MCQNFFSLYLNFPSLHFLFLTFSPSIFLHPSISQHWKLHFCLSPFVTQTHCIGSEMSYVRHTSVAYNAIIGIPVSKYYYFKWCNVSECKTNYGLYVTHVVNVLLKEFNQFRGQKICRVMSSNCQVLCYLQEDLMITRWKASICSDIYILQCSKICN